MAKACHRVMEPGSVYAVGLAHFGCGWNW